MNIKIEKAHPADAAALLEYLQRVGGETDNLTFGAEGLPISVEEEEKYIATMADSKDGVFLVAKEEGRIVGSASLSRLPRRMSHRSDLGVTVIKDCWNRGIGSMLLGAVIDFAKENSVEFIELQVRSDNLAAIHLYEKFGFKKICTYPDFFKIDGRYFDVEYMSLRLK